MARYGSLEVFKFCCYLSIPILMTYFIAGNPRNLEAIIRNVSAFDLSLLGAKLFCFCLSTMRKQQQFTYLVCFDSEPTLSTRQKAHVHPVPRKCRSACSRANRLASELSSPSTLRAVLQTAQAA